MFSPDHLAAWSGGEWSGNPPMAAGVSQDTRRLAPGDLYVALRGERFDGHDFVAEAFRRGAAAAMVDRAWTPPPGIGPLLRVADPLRALGDLARGHRRALSGRCIAITGSLGKTTTKELISAALSAAGDVARTQGNWNNAVGLPLSILAMRPSDAFGVFEAGMNHPGELAPLCDILRPDWGVITRIAAVHIEFFPSEEAIAEEKSAVVRALPPDGVAFLAADEPWFDLLRARTRARVVTVAWQGAADYVGAFDPARPDRIVVRERSGRAAEYPAPGPGEPIRRAALRAIAVARELALAPAQIAAGLARYAPPPMRWEMVEIGGVRWINDAYNASPLSMEAALRTFRETPAAGRRWLVLGGMRELGERSEAEHAALGRAVAGGDWAGLVTVGELGGGIARAAVAAGWPSARAAVCADAAAAVEWLRPRLAPGDAVLLKGSRGERVERVLECWRAADDASAAPRRE